MKETNETTAEESNEELSSLKGVLQKALDEGDMQRAGEIKEEMLPHLDVVKEGLGVSPEKAREIMGEDFLGPEEIEKAFNIKIEKEDTPKIPFSKEELEKAEELDQILVLRARETADHKDLTMEEIQGLSYSQNGCILDKNWFIGADFYCKYTPRSGWALISGEVPMETQGKNYLRQSDYLAHQLKEVVFDGKKVPKDYQEALAELEKRRMFLGKIIGPQPSGAQLISLAEDLTRLKMNKLLRHTPVELFYDQSLFFLNRGKLLYDKAVLTNEPMQTYVVALDFSRDRKEVCGFPAYSSGAIYTVMSRRS